VVEYDQGTVLPSPPHQKQSPFARQIKPNPFQKIHFPPLKLHPASTLGGKTTAPRSIRRGKDFSVPKLLAASTFQGKRTIKPTYAARWGFKGNILPVYLKMPEKPESPACV